MRPPTPAALGLLLLLLLPPPPPGETAKKATPCKRCRELVDKFNQVGRSPHADAGSGSGSGPALGGGGAGVVPRWTGVLDPG